MGIIPDVHARFCIDHILPDKIYHDLAESDKNYQELASHLAK